jgi:hypothetical protein
MINRTAFGADVPISRDRFARRRSLHRSSLLASLHPDAQQLGPVADAEEAPDL